MSQTTKRALAQSLKKLLQTKPLSKITINDIAEDCGVSRMTFYYHFADIYDLVEWTCQEDASVALAGNKTFVLNVYHSISREHLERYLYQLTYDLLIGVVEEKAVGLSVSDRDKAFIADFYKYAFVGLMLNWIREGMKEDPTAIIDRLNVLIHGDITRALHKYSAH